MTSLIDGLGMDVAAVTPAFARQVAEAYARWENGIHPAGLNFGDCFSYALAKEIPAGLSLSGIISRRPT